MNCLISFFARSTRSSCSTIFVPMVFCTQELGKMQMCIFFFNSLILKSVKGFFLTMLPLNYTLKSQEQMKLSPTKI